RKPSLAKMFQNAINRENILTTHSPSLSASLPAKSIVMLDGANGYAQVVNADNREVVERLTNGQWTLQQQNIFLASNKDIILVEGKTDETFLSKALTYFKQTGQFLDHDYDFLPCGGAPGVVLLKDRFIPKSNQHIYCFFDNDKAGWESINKIFNPPVKFDKRNFGKARKNINIWIAPYPHKKTTPSCDFNIEDYFKRNIFTRYVLKFRSLNEIMTKDRIKNEISDDCIKGQIHDKDFLRFSEVFELINEIKIADANSQNTVP
ncbi:MAG: hypothetical protein IKZ46_11940, partial [Victivallales bacterium]|nr:hypothetical protein [Victivallales bacterium]